MQINDYSESSFGSVTKESLTDILDFIIPFPLPESKHPTENLAKLLPSFEITHAEKNISRKFVSTVKANRA